jgi:SNF2 family DNA or RNA helicase
MIWFEVSWSSESTIQLLRRIARPGQTKPVFSHRIVADHWLEQKRIERVERKIKEEQDFIATLRTV